MNFIINNKPSLSFRNADIVSSCIIWTWKIPKKKIPSFDEDLKSEKAGCSTGSRVATHNYILKASDSGRTKKEKEHESSEEEWCPQGCLHTDWDIEGNGKRG